MSSLPRLRDSAPIARGRPLAPREISSRFLGDPPEERVRLEPHVEGLLELEHVPQHDIQGGHLVSVAAAVAVLGLLVEPAARVLGPDGVDAGLGEGTLEPGEHQVAVDPVRVDEEEDGGGGHVLESKVLVLGGGEELKHPEVVALYWILPIKQAQTLPDATPLRNKIHPFSKIGVTF